MHTNTRTPLSTLFLAGPSLKSIRMILTFALASVLSTGALAQDDVLAKSQSINMASGETVVESAIDINTANAAQLASLTNIGLKKAKEIIAYREANGLFISIDDLSKVKGIGLKTIEKNRDRIVAANK